MVKDWVGGGSMVNHPAVWPVSQRTWIPLRGGCFRPKGHVLKQRSTGLTPGLAPD